jgi:hypothetical protein
VAIRYFPYKELFYVRKADLNENRWLPKTFTPDINKIGMMAIPPLAG